MYINDHRGTAKGLLNLGEGCFGGLSREGLNGHHCAPVPAVLKLGRADSETSLGLM
tara:strand:+ start:303 stop:470 length:168 start_codon:yes stop_codon:yes gene_type:complete